MPEIMPFGRMKDLSVEQICIKDYKYFTYILDTIELKKPSLRERFEFVEHAVNNFKSVLPCGHQGCTNTPKLISVYTNSFANYRGSSSHFIYCSRQCFDLDPNITIESNKVALSPLRFRTAISSTKADTKGLIKVMADCMGLREGKWTKEYLEEFFNNITCWQK